MTVNSKRWAILSYCIEKTREGKIKWEESPVNEMYYCSIGELGISISSAGADFILSLYNESGEIVEAISDPEFSNDGFMDAYVKMKELYDLARADATGSEEVADGILDALKRI